MGAENLVHQNIAPKEVVNIVKATAGAEIQLNDGSSIFTSGVDDIQIDGNIITIYRTVLNKRHSVDYTLGTLDKFGTSTPKELVLYWQANNFFFDVTTALIPETQTVNQYADLPSPAINFDGEYWLVDEPQGSNWLFNLKDAGIYKSVGGVWEYRGPDVPAYFKDDQLLFTDNAGPGEMTFTLDALTQRRNVNWPDKDGIIMFDAVNIVHVESLADFPTPISNFIPLSDNTIYYIHGVVNIGANGFDFTGVNAKLQGNYNGSDEIVSTTTGNLIKGIVTFGISINDLKLTSLLSDKHYNISGTGNEIFIIDNVLCEGSLAIGTISDLRKCVIRNQTEFQGFSQGILFDGNFDLILFRDVILAGIAGTSIDLGTSIFGSIEINAVIIDVPNGGTGISMLPNGGNFAGGDHGIIFACEFLLTGTGVSTVGYSVLDLEWNVLSNENLDDSDRIIPTGWGFYQDGETTPITQLITTVPQKLSIDGAGVQTETSFLPKAIRGVSELWDTINNKITPIVIGDSYDVGIDIEIIAKSGGVSQIEMVLDIGGAAGITNPVIVLDTFVGKTPPFTKRVNFLMFTLSTFLLNGGQIFLSADTGTVTIASRQITISRNSSGAS